MIEKPDRRVLMTKRLLKESLIELLKDKDIYHISIRELCERADVNRSTFYKYYGSQFDLLADMESDMIEFIQKTISKNIESQQRIIEKMCYYLEENIEFARLIVNNNIDPTFAQKVFSLEIIKGIVFNSARHVDEEEFEYVYTFLVSGAFAEISLWLNKENRESPKKMGVIIERQIAKLFK